MVSEEPLAQGKELILAAFEDAKASGNPDWQRMNAAVLKNRLLDMTRREFKESAYGATTLSGFIRLFPEIIELDESTPQKVVILKSSESLPESAEALPEPQSDKRMMIRPDFWQAVVDYRSGTRYVWDSVKGIARPADDSDTDSPVIPTLSEGVMRAWRETFLGQIGSELSDYERARVTQWISKGYGNAFLPVHLQYRWNSYMQDCIVDRVGEFFRGLGEAAPVDLLVEYSQLREVGRSVRRRPDVGFQDLRSLVLKCVEVMTDEELVRLTFSPDVYLRVSRRFGE